MLGEKRRPDRVATRARARSDCSDRSRGGRRARHSDTSQRKWGFSSGAPPVMSTVGIVVCSSASRHSSIVSRVIISRRSGPASTWQWRHVWLQSLPTLIWKISMRVGPQRPLARPLRRLRRSRAPGAGGPAPRAEHQARASGSRRERRERDITYPVSRHGRASEYRARATRRRESRPRRARPPSSGRDPPPSRARPGYMRRCSTGTGPRARRPGR